MHQVTKRNYYLRPGLSPQSTVFVKATEKLKNQKFKVLLLIMTSLTLSSTSRSLTTFTFPKKLHPPALPPNSIFLWHVFY